MLDLVMFAIAGDSDGCGTKYPRWWGGPRPKWWWVADLFAAGAGVAGGTAVERFVGGDIHAPLTFVASLAGAFVVGKVAGAITTLAIADDRVTQPQAIPAKAPA